eukprot:SAG31_NODE_1400_length_8499_cov_2.809762_11_plen_84_part_00
MNTEVFLSARRHKKVFSFLSARPALELRCIAFREGFGVSSDCSPNTNRASIQIGAQIKGLGTLGFLAPYSVPAASLAWVVAAG